MTIDNQHIVAQLNPAQRQAVESLEGPLLILAGPGSGKTRVITHRIANMIAHGIPAHQIVALTFTNKAADEMRQRIEQLVPGYFVWSTTFHKFCSRLLRIHAPLVGLSENFTIYDAQDSKKLVKQAIDNLDIDLRHYKESDLANRISQLKNQGVTSEALQYSTGNYLYQILGQVYPAYQRMLQMSNGVDFDDLLLHCVQLLRENPEIRETLDHKFAYMMVDEYQDTNTAQYQLVRMLNASRPNLAVTGDPDQSIYGWRGANLGNILDFERDYPDVKVIRLEQNYRSTKKILRVADQLILNNVRRKHKQLHTDLGEGNSVRMVAYPNPEEESRDIAQRIANEIREGKRRPRDYAIFYRTNALSRSFEHSLRAAGVPYQVVQGLEFYQRREIKDLVAFLHLLNNDRDSVAFERVINTPPRQIGKTTIDRMKKYTFDAGGCLLETARVSGTIPGLSKAAAVRVSNFVALYDRLAEFRGQDVGTIIRAVIHETKYREWLVEDGSEEGHERANNVDELVAAADEFDRQHPDDGGLEAFLEQAALVNDVDAWESQSDYVTMLTIHAAKGLEFPSVFIVGLEDGILPHERCGQEADAIEEERRLLFVGITRAEQDLQISRCLSRFKKGGYWPSIASRFLMELPRHEMQINEPTSNFSFGDPADDDWASQIDPWLHEGVEGTSENFATNASSARSQPISAAAPPRLITAAELQRQQSETNSTRLHPSVYQEGMLVEHPEYGQGRIVSLTGQGMKRTAAVDFSQLGKRSFRLAFCDLRLVSDE